LDALPEDDHCSVDVMKQIIQETTIVLAKAILDGPVVVSWDVACVGEMK
jgi:hypothetical protein